MLRMRYILSLSKVSGSIRATIFAIATTCALCCPITTQAGDSVEDAGDATRIALPVFASLVALADGDKLGFLQHVASFAVTTGITHGLKASINSERPNRRNNKSFPSGHASQAFASASFLDHRYGWQYGLPAYAAATFVAFSRVDSDNHRIRDVAASAVIAWGVSHFIVDPRGRVTVEGEVISTRALLRIRFKW